MEFVPLDPARDGAAVANIASRSMQASYALSPEQIESIVEEEFHGEVLDEKADRDGVVLLVARGEETGEEGRGEETDETGDGTEVVEPGEANAVQGFAEGEMDGDEAEIRWLHVDPEIRGAGIGTELFEHLTAVFDERGATEIRSQVLSQGVEGDTFCEQFGFVRVEGVEVEIGDQTMIADVYANPSAIDPQELDQLDPIGEDEDPPERAEASDGTEVFIDPDDPLSGTLGRFFKAYTTADFEEQYGYYCGASRTVTTDVDGQERIVCPECGNIHQPSEWDGSYL